MSSPATRAQSVLNNAISKGNLPISNTYCYYLPNDVMTDTSHSVILISEVSDMAADYGSNRSTTMKERIALNIYYALNTTIDFDCLEQKIISAFEADNWSLTYSPGHSVDPSTKQLTKVMQFQKFINRGEI